MRWLFLIVLFLNLAYIGWQTTRPVTQFYENVQPLKNVRPIVLLSEVLLSESEQQQADDIAAEQTAPLLSDDADKQHEERVRPDFNSEKPQSPLQIAEAVEAEETELVKKPEELKQPALTSGADQVVVDTEPLKAPDGLQEKALMSKDGQYFARSQEGDAIMSKDGQPDSRYGARSQEDDVIQKASCFTMGPFRDLDKLRSLTREIKPYVVTTDFRGREEREQSLYWVYIQPKKNRKKAIETGKRLRAKKIKDYYVIREGEKMHGVSLGRFRNKNSAHGLAKKVKKLGFDVIVEPIFKTYTIYWLDYQLANGVNIPEALFEQYTQPTKKGKVSRLSRSCDAEVGE